MLLLSIAILLNSYIVQSSVTISNTRNRFEIHISGRVSQIVDSPSERPNKSATYEAKLDNLELLRNTRILASNRGPCIISGEESHSPGNQTRASDRNGNTFTKRITFVEIAKVNIYYLRHRNTYSFRGGKRSRLLNFIIQITNKIAVGLWL